MSRRRPRVTAYGLVRCPMKDLTVAAWMMLPARPAFVAWRNHSWALFKAVGGGNPLGHAYLAEPSNQ